MSPDGSKKMEERQQKEFLSLLLSPCGLMESYNYQLSKLACETLANARMSNE